MARKLDEDKRRKILSAARHAFGEIGLEKTTIRHISRTADIAQGTVYTYFRNKEELFTAVVGDVWEEFMRGMDRISLSSATFLQKFAEFIEFGFELLTQVHPLLRGMFSELNRRELFASRLDQVCEFVEDLVAGAEAAGFLFDKPVSTDVRHFNINIIVSGILFRTALVPPEQLPDEIERIKNGLLAWLGERIGPIPGTSR